MIRSAGELIRELTQGDGLALEEAASGVSNGDRPIRGDGGNAHDVEAYVSTTFPAVKIHSRVG